MMGTVRRLQAPDEVTIMLDPEQISQVMALFPVFRQLPEADRREIFAAGQVANLPREQLLLRQNQQCQYIPLVLSGLLRIFKLAPNGREMTLYRIGAGETCLISVGCQMAGEDYPAQAQVEEDAQLFLLPAIVYHELLEPKPAWKDFVIQTMYGHLTEVLETLEAMAFERMDRRLVRWLLDRTRGRAGVVDATHESIAVELGTVREVVSRLLGELRGKGLVRQSRGKIEVVDAARLKMLLKEE
jgi:CRP/FNR family transcriptional regulator, anaerobic regulatory protein